MAPIESQAVGRPIVFRGWKVERTGERLRGRRDRLAAGGADIGICISVGPGPAPGVVTVVGMPLGVETPARPPRIPPVPGKLPNEPPRRRGLPQERA